MGDGLKRARAAARATRPPSALAVAAKMIRSDIKLALADGTLPALPEGVTVKVRARRASLMSSIDIDVMDAPHSWAYDTRPGAINRPSSANLLLREALRKIAERHYEADGQGRFIDVQTHLKQEG